MKKVIFTDQAKLDMQSLDRSTRLRIASALHRLAASNSGNVKKLQGIDPAEFRLRVGDWRIRFSYPEPNTIYVNRIANRKDAYR